jgi:hypothetical protein
VCRDHSGTAAGNDDVVRSMRSCEDLKGAGTGADVRKRRTTARSIFGRKGLR